MYKEFNMNDIYNDFFGKKSDNLESKDIDNDTFYDIDKLYLDDDSKKILHRITEYMNLYSEKKETNYLNFNISLTTNNDLITKEIASILSKNSIKCNYNSTNQVNDYSLYDLDSPDTIKNWYKNSGVIIIKDLNALSLQNDDNKNKFFHILKEQLLQHKITILSGNKEEINSFFINDNELENFFYFKLNFKNPDASEILKNIKNIIGNIELEDFDNKLLNYLNQTYYNSDLDYITYTNNLSRYISFNKELPLLDSPKSIDEIFKELNELVGLKNVKQKLNELVDLITLKKKTDENLKINNINLHMLFLGNPGTGKTTVARLICGILYELKYIKQNKLIEVSSKDLVAEYVGQSAPKTMNVINKAMGGVLFIDEAYTLADKENGNSYNAEVIATLIKAMEDYRDDLVVIFAGYTKEMQAFLNSNSGILSRIGYTFEFDDYTNDELKQIFIGMMKKSGFSVNKKAIDKLDEIIDIGRKSLNFGNARFIRNVCEKTILKHASNTKDNENMKTLKEITEKDISI